MGRRIICIALCSLAFATCAIGASQTSVAQETGGEDKTAAELGAELDKLPLGSKDWSTLHVRWYKQAQKEDADAAARRLLEKSPPGDPFKWARDLTVPGSGGWEYIDSDGAGLQVTYGTRANSTWRGSHATVWLRTEYRDYQADGGTRFQSLASRTEFDCNEKTSKSLSQIVYSEGDLKGTAQQQTYTTSLAEPILPGTMAADWLLIRRGDRGHGERTGPTSL